MLYVLVEEEQRSVAEMRVLSKESGSVVASLDFVVEDRRRLPRVRIEGFIEMEAELSCGGSTLKGKVIELSATSLSIRGEVLCRARAT